MPCQRRLDQFMRRLARGLHIAGIAMQQHDGKGAVEQQQDLPREPQRDR